MSEATVNLIDGEIRRFVDEAYELAQKVLREKSDDLEAIAQALIEYETLTGDELRALVEGEGIHRDTDLDDEQSSGSTPQTVPTAGKSKRPPISGSPEPQGT
jgi:cell division protease FtsH